jgi:outer membrane receptor for ferrienterochelin and colicins
MVKKKLVGYVGALISFLVMVSTVSAKEKIDTDLEELLSYEIEDIAVWVASKRKEKLSQAPGIVSVITTKDIQSYGANNLQDLLSRLPNVYVWGSGLARDNVVSIRGQVQTHLDNHVLILLNGRPIRGGTSSGVQLDIYRNFPLESIERIEMVRGPGSVLYGTNAFSGVINIVSKDPQKLQKKFYLNRLWIFWNCANFWSI